MNILEFLKNNTPDNKRTEQFVHKRFSEQAGEDVVFTLQGLSFDCLSEIERDHEEDQEVYVVLESVVEPNLKDSELRKKYKVAGYDELVKEIFLPGELKRIANHVYTLSGYGVDSVKKLEKNSQSVQD